VNTSGAFPTFNPARPLLLLDADEVLLQFVGHLESYLVTVGYELRLESFQLSGNIYHRPSGKPAEPFKVRELIASYFEACVHETPAVDGAAEALGRLAEYFEIAVLSNVPRNCRTRRAENLKAQGMPYPVISNKGDKGPAAAELVSAHQAKGTLSVFVDDLPPQLKSVRAHSPNTHLVHFIADPRLAAMIGKTTHADIRIDDWKTLEQHLMTLVD